MAEEKGSRDTQFLGLVQVLKDLQLDLYLDPDMETPSLRIPGDRTEGHYPIGSKRVERWLFGVYLGSFHTRPRSDDLKAAVQYLECLAYDRGTKLPDDEQADRFNDDPVLFAIHSMMPKSKDSAERLSAADAFRALQYYGKEHPNFKSWPKNVAALGRKIRFLENAKMLESLKIGFQVEHTVTGKIWTFRRTDTPPEGMMRVAQPPSGRKSLLFKRIRTDDTDLLSELGPPRHPVATDSEHPPAAAGGPPEQAAGRAIDQQAMAAGQS
jgi:hypothetical protein